MARRILLTFLVFAWHVVVYATHQRSAEITYRHLSGLTYEVTIVTYTYAQSPADRCDLIVVYSDGNSAVVPRVNGPPGVTPGNIECPHTGELIEPTIRRNVYRSTHTFPSPGQYTISMEDPNRNFGVVNIPGSVNVPMYVESTLLINPFLGNNNSVQLLNPPIDKGCVGKLFIHNASAWDPDGDSLSYRLVNCKGANGLDIPGYSFPQASEQFFIDAVTGDLIWENPIIQGEYNVAFIIEEWRNGVKIGSVTRDLQIDIAACDNNPPDIFSLTDTCIVAGNSLLFDVTAIDPDGDLVTLTASGGPFELPQNPASISPDPASGNDTVTTTFIWNTDCSHVRRSSYTALFKARDNNPIVSLSNYKAVQITVIGPPVRNVQAEPLGNSIILNWDAYYCTNATGFSIYRRSGALGWEPGHCETGVPAYTGYTLIGQTNNISQLSFTDDNNGAGLVPGIDYCYRVTAIFPDGAESQASIESCAALKRDLPIMTHVSNDSLDLSSGRVLTAWSRPVDLDTVQFPGPYRYNLFRGEGTNMENPAQVFTGMGLNDTLFTDNDVNLNTAGSAYSYYVQLVSMTVGNIGNSKPASSLYLELFETDNEIVLSWNPKVPWINDTVEIFRLDPGQSDFQLVGISATNRYRDTGLINETEYCYYIRSIGGYSVPGVVDPIINYSQIACGMPIDNVPPCPPILSVETDCEMIENMLSWINPHDSCSYDITKYIIYYTPSSQQAFAEIETVFGLENTTFDHRFIEYITGCYYVKAVDDNNNISETSNIVCVAFDACPIYELPNVFTPNGDQINDFLVPMNYPTANPRAVVERVEMTIFSRWGTVVFETTDPAINWDGKDQRSGKDVAQGVYFYVCKVYVATFEGIEKIILQGSVTVMR